jgi:hypothetical protein
MQAAHSCRLRAIRMDMQLQRDAGWEPWRVTRRDRRALAQPVSGKPAVSDSRSSGASPSSPVTVEGELGTWHERDAIDPAIPDILPSCPH